MSFAARAARCDELSKSGGSLDQYFGFLRMLSQAQDDALRAWSESDDREASFDASVGAIAQRLRTQATPRVAASLDRVLHAAPEQRAAWADALRAGEHDAILPDVMPFVGAALQLQWHVRATQAKATATPAEARTTHCPVCAAPPLASILRRRDGVEGLRFLYCGICGTDWHYERITCSTCEATKGISYRFVPGAEHVKAEVCESCNAYRKIWYQSPADPIADDLATMHLDVLMGEAGVRRMSPNPLFAFG